MAKCVSSGSGGEQAADILDHHQVGVEGIDGADDVMPQAGAGAGGESSAGPDDREALTGESGREHAHGFHAVPVDGSYVAVVGHTGPVPGEYAGGVGVGLGWPGGPAAEGGLDTQV